LYILQFEQPLVAGTQTFIIRRGVRGGVVSIIRGVLRHQANKQAAHKQPQ